MEAVPVNLENIFLLRKANVWYTMMDGSWNNPDVWISNAIDKRNIQLPQAGDTVYINHNIDYSNNYLGPAFLFNNTVNNLYIAGKLTANGSGLYQNQLIVNGNLQCSGTIDFSSTVSSISVYLNGIINSIANLNAGTQSYFIYNSPFDQAICPQTYYNLNVNNTCTKYLSGDVVVTGSLTIAQGSTLQLGAFNYMANSTIISGSLKKNSSTGVVTFTGISSTSSTGSLSFTASPTVNISGNFTADVRAGFNFGTGTMNIIANSTWTITGSGNTAQTLGSMAIIIASGVTLTIAAYSGANTGGWVNTGSITGASSTSTLNINGTYAYGNTNVAMPVGVFNWNNSGTSMIQVQSGVTITLPMTSFYALNIVGAASISGNTTVSSSLTLSGSLQLSSYNFTCSGTLTYSGTLLKSGGGTVNLNALSNQNSTGSISFSGSPTVNLSGNVTGDSRGGINFGSGSVNITSSINIGIWNAGNNQINIASNIVIASGVTLTNTGLSTTTGGLILTGTITGADSTAIFMNKSIFNYQNATAPMATGYLYCNQAANTFIYGLAGNQNITVPSDPTSPGYYNLTLNNSGTKTLQGNVSVKQVYTLTSPATLNSNGYLLTNP